MSEAVSDQITKDPSVVSQVWRALRRIMAEPLGAFGLILVVMMIAGSVMADWLTIYEPTKISPRDRFQGASWNHLLGTDQLGRDLFSRVLHGGRIALSVALFSTAASLMIGIVLGLIAGYGPRWLDNLMLLVFDSIKSFPTVMLALALVTLFGPSLTAVVVVVVLVNTPGYARIIRTQTLALKESEFVTAAQSMGRRHGAHPAGAYHAECHRTAVDPCLDGHSCGHRHRGGDELPWSWRPPAHTVLGCDSE